MGHPYSRSRAARSRLAYPLLRGLVRAVSGMVFRVRYRGLERVPESGPLLLVANHPSYLDPFLIGAALRLRPRYLVYRPYMDHPLLGPGIRYFGGMPVGDDFPVRTVKTVLRLLRAGDILELFPEGQRSPDGRVLPFRRGFAHLARVTGSPVLPIALLGAFDAWPPGCALPRARPVEVLFGQTLFSPGPSHLPPGEGRRTDREFAETVRQNLLALSGGRLLPGQNPVLEAAGPPIGRRKEVAPG
ncbi:MAG: lysophospholipid acyltransferase family protein [Acidobacteriota bacterium]